MNLEKEFSFLERFKWKKPPAVARRPWRTVAEIIASGFFYSCSEPARVFLEQVRKQGLLARLMVFMDSNSSVNDILGHCYAEVSSKNGQWIKVDPTQKMVIDSYPDGWTFVTNREDWPSFSAYVNFQKALIK
jgi:hypothetical protein